MTRFTMGARACVLLLLAVAMMAAAPPAFAQAARVTEIEVRGNQNINRETILTAVSTKVGDEASPERLERDRLAIEALGWFRLVTLLIQPVDGNARVVFVVNEYPVVKQIQVTGSSILKDEELQALLKTKTDQVFNRVTWEEDLAAIEKLYSQKGYRIRLIHNTAQPQPDAAFLEQGNLRLEIHELKVGQIDIKWPVREIKDKKGNVVKTVESHKTKDYVVRRELAQKPGALYNVEQIGKDYRALSALGYFETINPVVEPGQEVDTVKITWELTEKRTGQVSVGAGYSPRQQLIGRAELSDQNFQGKGRAVSIAGEIGTFGGDGAPSVELQFHEPWLTSQRTSVTVSLYNKLIYRFSRTLVGNNDDFFDDDRYFERRFGGQVNFGRPFALPITAGLRYDNVETGARLPRSLDFPRQDGSVIAGSLGRTWNSRNYVNNPTSGAFTRLIGETGYATLDNDDNSSNFDAGFFQKLIVDYRRYIGLKKIKATKEPEREQEAQKIPVLAFRAMAGQIVGDVPFFEQFFMGGAESLRGYLEDRFWGNTMYLASVEYRRPLLNRIVGVVFVDVGDAFGSDSAFQFRQRGLRTRFRQHDDIRPFAAIGIGLRVATPIGPIRLDFGYGEEGGRTHFSIGHAF